MEKHRAGTGKFMLGLFCCFALLIGTALLFGTQESAPVSAPRRFRGIRDNEGRLQLLAAFGWETEDAPAEVVEVTIPRKFDAVYESYNALQKPLGLDLFPRRGQTVRRYTYVVKNHPYEGTVYANLLFSGDEFIGGDVCSAAPDGFLTSLQKDA